MLMLLLVVVVPQQLLVVVLQQLLLSAEVLLPPLGNSLAIRLFFAALSSGAWRRCASSFVSLQLPHACLTLTHLHKKHQLRGTANLSRLVRVLLFVAPHCGGAISPLALARACCKSIVHVAACAAVQETAVQETAQGRGYACLSGRAASGSRV
jgi:hypothetical protein